MYYTPFNISLYQNLLSVYYVPGTCHVLEIRFFKWIKIDPSHGGVTV